MKNTFNAHLIIEPIQPIQRTQIGQRALISIELGNDSIRRECLL